MSLSTHLSAILCVGLIAAGQVLFKLLALQINAAGTVFNPRIAVIAGASLALYGFATLLWIALLQHAPLGRLYPYMALSFVLVAVAGAYLFGEPVTAAQVAGLGCIVLGLVLIAAA